jgi:PAS domain S-box-containing protein
MDGRDEERNDLWPGPDAPGESPRGRKGLLQTVLDSLTHPFYVIDAADYRVCLANRAARAIYASEAATCHALTHGRQLPCDAPEHPCPLEQIKRTGKPATTEHTHYDKKGRPRYVEVHGFPIFDSRGDISQVIEYCVDVTEHRCAIAQLQWELNVNRALAVLADAMIDPGSSVEEVADIVLEQARRLTGSEHGFVSSIDPETKINIGHTLTHMMGDRCGVQARDQRATFAPRPDGTYPGLWGHALNTGRGYYTNAADRHPASSGAPSGHIPIKSFLTVPAVFGDEVVGQIALANAERGYSQRELEAIERMAKLYALAIERRRSEVALRASEERYALAQHAANVGSWDWNIITGKLLWSERIEPMFGFARGQFAGTYEAFLKAVHPDDRQFVTDSVNACVQRGEDYCIQHRIVWPDGTIRWVSETGDVVRDSAGEAVRMLGVVRDITEQKRAEQEIRKLNEQLEMRVIERTAELAQANASLRAEIQQRHRLEQEILDISEREQRRIGRELHDSLGQQLTGIAIMTKVLEQKLQRQAPGVAADANEIAHLVNEAVSQTRQLSRGLHPVALDEHGLMSALEALATTTQSIFGVACTFRCERPVPVRDPFVATHLYRIAQEAVTNAIRHGDTSGIALELTAQHNRATLTVDNNGRDFPPERPEREGMGLKVMDYRAEMIGGTLDVRRRPEGGTRVTCTLELASEIPNREKQHARKNT